MELCSLSSGSSGNCIYVGVKGTGVLIDVGLSGKRIENGLKTIGIAPTEIQGILITHEHSDHIKGLGVMARRYGLPIYATKDTIHALRKNPALGVMHPDLFQVVRPDEPFTMGPLTVLPFETSHDAIHPVCYSFTHGDKKISVATDLGHYTDYIKDHLLGAQLLFLEANHDVKMLDVGPYPYYLKQRIKSQLGHLSNDATSALLCELYHEGLKHIVLGHLSHENNYPDVAYETIKSELMTKCCNLESVTITVALRDQVSELFVI